LVDRAWKSKERHLYFEILMASRNEDFVSGDESTNGDIWQWKPTNTCHPITLRFFNYFPNLNPPVTHYTLSYPCNPQLKS